MNKLAIILSLYFLSSKSFAGCTGPTFKTNNGFDSWHMYHSSYTVTTEVTDSTIVSISGGNCYGLRSVTISLNGEIIHTCSDSRCNFKLPNVSGQYLINAVNRNLYFSSCAITLNINVPEVQDTTSKEPLLSAIPVSPTLNPDFLIYPNPARDEITLLNEAEEIKQIFIYDFSGKLMANYQPHKTKVTLPINDLPDGIYFVQAATLSEKIIYKKLVVR